MLYGLWEHQTYAETLVSGLLLSSREELDNHLDTMQVDLEQLREVLSLQGNPLDASTLLGVCDSLGLSFEPTLDSCNWTGYPSATWNWRGIPSESSPLLASLLEHQMLPKVAKCIYNHTVIEAVVFSSRIPSHYFSHTSTAFM